MKKGETKGKAHQLLMHSPIDGSILTNPVRVTTQKHHSRKCYMSDYGTVGITKVCEPCRVKTPKAFLSCPEVLKVQA